MLVLDLDCSDVRQLSAEHYLPHATLLVWVGMRYSRGVLHPFVRIRVINNRSPIMHNQWEWVIYNRRKSVPFFPPFFGFRSFFVLNIPILSPIIYNRTLNIIGIIIGH